MAVSALAICRRTDRLDHRRVAAASAAKGIIRRVRMDRTIRISHRSKRLAWRQRLAIDRKLDPIWRGKIEVYRGCRAELDIEKPVSDGHRAGLRPEHTSARHRIVDIENNGVAAGKRNATRIGQLALIVHRPRNRREQRHHRKQNENNPKYLFGPHYFFLLHRIICDYRL